MLPVKKIADYGRKVASNMRIQDLEEAEAIAIHSLAYSYEKAQESEKPMAYMRLFARNKIRRHFFDKRCPGRLPNNFEIEYDGEDRIANIIEGMNLTPFEEKIIQLRIDGYTDPEIGKITGRSRQLITKYRRQMKEKFSGLEFLHQ